jgi:branched-chain amino acid transport system substrate-binding protein
LPAGLGAVALLLVVSACGSGGSKSSAATTPTTPPATTAGSGGPTPTTASSATPIVVGNIGSYTGPASGDYVGADKVVAAWAQSVNASGGINGHPVKVVVKDDGGDPARSLALVKELVEQDHVVALVAVSDAADTSWSSYVQTKGIPVINGLPGGANFTNKNPSLFLIGASIPSFGTGAGLAAKGAGRSQVGLLYCAEDPGCAQLKAVYQPLIEAVGVKFAFAASAAASSPDYTAVCLAAQHAGADALDVDTVQAVWPRMAHSCESQGYHPLFIFPGAGDLTPLLGDSSLNGSVLLYSTFPGFVSDPATKPYQDAVAKYLPGETTLKLGGAGSAAWLSGTLFEAATKNLPAGFTAKDVFTGLYSLHNETLGGLAPGPLNFTAGVGLAGVNCVYQFKIVNQTLTAPNGIHATCPTTG